MVDFFELFVIIDMKSTLFHYFDFTHRHLFLIEITWSKWVIVISSWLESSWLLIVACVSFHLHISLRWLAVSFCAQFHSPIIFRVTKFWVIASSGKLLNLRSCSSITLAIIVIFHTILVLVWRFVISNLGRIRIYCHFLVIIEARWPILSLPGNVAVILVALFIRCLESALR